MFACIRWAGLALSVGALSACGLAPQQESVATQSSARVTAQKSEVASGPVVSEKQLIAAVDEANSIFFPADGVTVDAEGRRRLIEHAARLKASPDKSVMLVGHTDDLGSPSYNLAIAEQRVNAVYAVLRSQGVPPIQIRRYGVGAEQGGPACKSAACRRAMRRVQLIFE